MYAPEESGGTRLEENSPVARVAAAAGLVNGRRLVAIQGQGKPQTLCLLAEQREDRGVTPFRQNHIGIFPLEQARKSKRGRFAGLIELPTRSVHFDFESGVAAMRGIDARQPGEPNLHDLERRHFVVEGPFVVAARDGLDSVFGWDHLL